MTMIPCKECGEIISDKLKTCPFCDHPLQDVKLPAGLAIVALVLGVIGLVCSALFNFTLVFFWGVLGLSSWMYPSILICWLFVFIYDLLVVTLGNIAIYKARRGEAGGEREAKIGLVCGVVGIVFIVLWGFIL